MTVGRDRRLILETLQLFLLLLIGCTLGLVFGNCLFIRIDDHFAGNRIQNYGVTALHICHQILDTDDSRNFKRTGHNGTVAGTSAHFRRKSLGKFLVQGTCIRRCQILGNNDDRRIQRRKIRNRLSCQIAQQTERNILDVSSTLLEVAVIHVFKHRNHVGRNGLRSVFRIFL